MIPYESQYIINLRNILTQGKKEFNERTGISTYRLPSSVIIVDLQNEFPILKSKKVNWKVAINEVFWMFQKQSNNVNDLGGHIWDSWADEDGSIGKTYGYQLRQSMKVKGEEFKNQVDYVLKRLKENPSDRQCVLDMWNPAELGEMNLPPCVFSSVWSIIDGRLNCMVVQRSADYPVGVPFDTLEYAILTHLFARHLGVEVGRLTHVMADSHIYENQVDGVKEQIERRFYLDKLNKIKNEAKLIFKENAPTDFWKIKPEDLEIVDYDPLPPIKFEVAV